MAFELNGIEGRARLEPRAAEPARSCTCRRGAAAPRLHDGLRRRRASRTTATSSRATPTASASRTWWPSRITSSCGPVAGGQPHQPGFEDALRRREPCRTRCSRRRQRHVGRRRDPHREEDDMKTVRLTTAAGHRPLPDRAATEIDGEDGRSSPASSRSSATATSRPSGRRSSRCRTSCRRGAGRTSRGWRSPLSPTRKAMRRRQIMVATSSDRSRRDEHGHRGGRRPGQPPAGAAARRATRSQPHPRSRCCSRSSTSATRRPRSTTPSSRSSATGTASSSPSRSSHSLPQAVATMLDPADLRAGLPRPAPGRPGRGVRLPGTVLRAGVHQIPPAATRPRAQLRRAAAAARRPAAAHRRRRRRALLAGRGRAAHLRRAPRHPGGRDGRRQGDARRDHPITPVRSASTGATSANAIAAEADVVARRGHPPAGLHHRVVDRLRRRGRGSSASTPPRSTR